MTTTRRTFLIEAGKAIPVIAGATYFLACSSDSSPTTGSPPATTVRVTSTISAGHSHDVSIPLADLAGGQTRTYASSIDSAHTHSITLTAAQLAQVDGGAAVTVTSTVASGHTHDFTVQR